MRLALIDSDLLCRGAL